MRKVKESVDSLPEVRLKIGREGRLLIPVAYRKALGLRAGDVALLRERNGKVEILSAAVKRKRARELVAKHIPPNVSLAEALIAERRAEASREDG